MLKGQRREMSALSPRVSDRHHTGRARKNEPENRIVRMLRDIGIGIGTTLLVSALLLLLVAGMVFSSTDPDRYLQPAALLSLALVSLLCGFVTERISQGPVLPIGLSVAVLWTLITFLFSLSQIGTVGAFPPVYAWALRIPEFLLVLLGAYLAKSRPRTVRSRRRR